MDIREEPVYKTLKELMSKTYTLDLVPDKKKFSEKILEIKSEKKFRLSDELIFGSEKLNGSDRFLIEFTDLTKLFNFNLSLLNGASVLDIGPGGGGSSLLFLACGAKEVHVVEKVPFYADRIKFFADSFNLNLKVTKSIFEDFKTVKKFDFINCFGVFYFIKNQEQMLQKMHKMLNTDGFLHLETKINDAEGAVPQSQLIEWLLNLNFQHKNYSTTKRAYFLCNK